MQRWGIIVTAVYLLILVVFLWPLTGYVVGGDKSFFELLGQLFDPDGFTNGLWIFWLSAAVLMAVQALLLFVSVDTSRKRLRPRRHVLISVSTITFAVGLLSAAVFAPVVMAILGDDGLEDGWAWAIGLAPVFFWFVWGVVFYMYRQQLSERLDLAINRVIAGSILQLLIAVPCHIIVRQRNDCSAPGVTAFGIASGIAIMLLAFGPAVVFLYQKRLREYGDKEETAGTDGRRYMLAGASAILVALIGLFLFLPVGAVSEKARFRIAEGQSQAFLAELAVLADRFGLQHDYPNLTCNGRSVARVQIPQDRRAYVRYSLYSTYVLEADAYSQFTTAFHSLVDQYRDPAHAVQRYAKPLKFELFRTRLLGGVYWGERCELAPG